MLTARGRTMALLLYFFSFPSQFPFQREAFRTLLEGAREGGRQVDRRVVDCVPVQILRVRLNAEESVGVAMPRKGRRKRAE